MTRLRKAPASLRKRGLERIDDNIPEDHRVRLPAGALFTLCGERLLKGIRSPSTNEAGERPRTQGNDHVD